MAWNGVQGQEGPSLNTSAGSLTCPSFQCPSLLQGLEGECAWTLIDFILVGFHLCSPTVGLRECPYIYLLCLLWGQPRLRGFSALGLLTDLFPSFLIADPSCLEVAGRLFLQGSLHGDRRSRPPACPRLQPLSLLGLQSTRGGGTFMHFVSPSLPPTPHQASSVWT